MYDTGYIQHRVTSGYIKIWSGDLELPAFWAHPISSGAFPGLVLLHGWRGLKINARANVRRLAEAGFYVIAPDLFAGQNSDALLNSEAVQAEIIRSGRMHTEAALEVLRTHNRCNGKVGLIGWEVGAELAFEATIHTSVVQATVLFAGRPERHLDAVQDCKTHILIFYGDSDPEILPASLNRFSQAIFDSLPNTQMVVYPNLMNSFSDAESPAYHEAFANVAWQRTIEFLQTRLGAAYSS